MKSRKLALLLGLAAAAFSPAPAPAATPAPVVAASLTLLPDLVDRIMPGVVNISSVQVSSYEVFGMDDFMRFWGIPREHKQTSLGSGFIIDKEGFILTNNHVVQKASEVSVILSDKRQYRAKIIGRDAKMDLALLQIRDKDRKVPQNIVPVPLGNSEGVRIAETVIAVGNPFGLQGTVTAGIISAKNRTIGLGPFDNFLQTDASINPGNSGGPLFNLKGEVIGINTVIYSRTGQSGGLGFAIPSNAAKELIPDLKKYGHVPRPLLGILGQQVTPQLAEYYELPTSQGVIVLNLVEGGPAQRTGIRRGDIIGKVNGAATPDPYALERELAKLRPRDTVSVSVKRGARTIELKVRLDELPPVDEIPQGII